MIDTNELHRRIVARFAEFASMIAGERKLTREGEVFRVGKHGSIALTIKDGAALFFDHESGQGGDAVSCYAHVHNIGVGDAIKMLAGWVGLPPNSDAEPTQKHVSTPRKERARPVFPPMERGTRKELETLAKLRSISVHALLLEDDLGALRFATLYGHRAWILTEGPIAQARRLDGGLWAHIGDKKTYNLPGSWGSYPIGLDVAKCYPSILLCEGVPDYLAAGHFIEKTKCMVRWSVVGILGAGNQIPDYALPIFKGKRVRLYPHLGDKGAGIEAAEKWAAQLRSAGAGLVDSFSFEGLRKADGSPVEDLNDCTQIHPDDAAELEGLLP